MEEKKKKKGGKPAVMLIFLACGVIAGVLIGTLGVGGPSEEEGIFAFLSRYLLQVILLLLAYYAQIILHEGGHLIAGLMTGYRFSSFRIGSLMLLKTTKGYSFCRFSLAGTGGQCLLIPPEKSADGSYSYRFYHMGGVLMNLLTAILFFLLWLPAGCRFCLYMAVIGLLTAAINGIPVKWNGLPTDGYNVIHIGKEPFALDAMWLQLKINEAQTEGTRLKDLPEEWFRIPEGADKRNAIISSIEVFAENRAMDAMDFDRAKELIDRIGNSGEYEIVGLYKTLLLFDRITIDLSERGAEADTSGWDTDQSKTFRKAMAKFPAVIRTEYAVRLLKEKDPEAAKKCRVLLGKVMKKYPLRSDTECENELLDYLDSCVK